MCGQEEDFGTRLRRHREAAGLSQEALAECAGLSANAISALERGERKRPYPDTIRRLADALRLDERDRATLAASISREPDSRSRSSGTRDERPTSLPGEPTPLIGREREADVIRHLLLHSGGRPLTLTGPGGVGKTRLALHVARDVREHLPDGVAWVDLGALTDVGQVIPAVARSVGLEETLGGDPVDALPGHLAGRRMLLVLDNFEHVLDAARDVGMLLGACPDLLMLVTSRAPLNIRGEQEYVVPPLELPTAPGPGREVDITSVPSVQLFAWYARQRDASFELSPEIQGDVAAICRRLDGVPLALELAAARVKVLGTSDLLRRLDNSLPVLIGGPRDLPARQRTMESAIRWSYDLLQPSTQALFRRLAIFSGGWTLEAAEAVAGGDLDIDLLDGLTTLVDQSLVRKEQKGSLAHRFTMLETLREFGLARLDEAGERGAMQAAHLAWCVTLAEDAEQGLAGPDQAAWLYRLEAEHDNLRAALGSTTLGSGEERLRLAGALWRFWWWHGHLTEGRAWLAQLLEPHGDVHSPWRGKALTAAGILAREQGDFTHATTVLEEAFAIRQDAGDTRGAAQSLNILGLVAMNQGALERAVELYDDALALYRDVGFDPGIANVLNNLASAMRDMGNFSRAISLYEESLAIYSRLGEKRATAGTLHNLGRVRRDLGELDEARRLFERSLAIEEELGDRLNMAMTHHNLGRVASDMGNTGLAARMYRQSLDVRLEFGDRLGCIKVVEDVAALAVGPDPALAARLNAAAAALREALGAPIPPADQAAAQRISSDARARLTPEAHREAIRAGRGMDASQAVTEALTFLHAFANLPLETPSSGAPS